MRPPILSGSREAPTTATERGRNRPRAGSPGRMRPRIRRPSRGRNRGPNRVSGADGIADRSAFVGHGGLACRRPWAESLRIVESPPDLVTLGSPPDASRTRKRHRMSPPVHGPTSHIYYSQRLRLHYVDWGNRRRPAPAARARRPGPLPELGLGGGGVSGRLPRDRARPQGSRGLAVDPGRRVHAGRLRLRHRAAPAPDAAHPRHHRLPLAREAPSRSSTPGSTRTTW